MTIKFVQSGRSQPDDHLRMLFCTIKFGKAFETRGSYWNYPAPDYFTDFNLEFIT
jgi:hypothetical protein